MTGRATTRAISATDLNEGDSDAVRIRHQLDAWANASPRTPRLVATPAEDLGVEPSGEAPVAAKKRSRSSPAPSRAKASKDTKAKAARTTKAKTTKARTEEPRWRAGSARRAARAADGFRCTHRAGGGSRRAGTRPHQPRLCPVAALALATVAAYFSVAGMAEIFPGDPVAVMVLAATMEAGKLVIAGWLAAHWGRTNWKMRFVMVALVAGLALINAAGVFGKLVEAHVSVAASSRFRRHRAHRSARRPRHGANRCCCRPERPHCESTGPWTNTGLAG